MEDGVVIISRAASSLPFRARFMLVAAMNPWRFDGIAPEYWPMVASVGSLAGILNQVTVNSDPVTYYYLSDHLTTAQLLVDEFGEIAWQGNYTPFGEVDVVINELENNFRFPGQYFDAETGLHYNWTGTMTLQQAGT